MSQVHTPQIPSGPHSTQLTTSDSHGLSKINVDRFFNWFYKVLDKQQAEGKIKKVEQSRGPERSRNAKKKW
jgi:hypothetical protein